VDPHFCAFSSNKRKTQNLNDTEYWIKFAHTKSGILSTIVGQCIIDNRHLETCHSAESSHASALLRYLRRNMIYRSKPNRKLRMEKSLTPHFANDEQEIETHRRNLLPNLTRRIHSIRQSQRRKTKADIAVTIPLCEFLRFYHVHLCITLVGSMSASISRGEYARPFSLFYLSDPKSRPRCVSCGSVSHGSNIKSLKFFLSMLRHMRLGTIDL
jgi:hypothetical protein